MINMRMDGEVDEKGCESTAPLVSYSFPVLFLLVAADASDSCSIS